MQCQGLPLIVLWAQCGIRIPDGEALSDRAVGVRAHPAHPWNLLGELHVVVKEPGPSHGTCQMLTDSK